MLIFGSKYEKFWKWFRANENELFEFEADQERIFDKLARHLCRVHRDLTFEFSGIADGNREFVISAGGIRTAFQEVTALVQAAPALSRWQVIAFRQRKDMPTIRYGGKSVERDSVLFSCSPAGDKIELTIFMDGLANGSAEDVTAIKMVGYLLLDATVGEYDVETKIAGIEFVDSSAPRGNTRLPLRDLPKIIDGLPQPVQ